jgi:signal transduction histidine kinase
MKILVAEDNVLFANSIEIIIEELGYDLAGIADNADDFFKLYEASLPDLLLLDIQLNGAKDGIDIATHILATAPFVPVIFMTAFKNDILFERAKAINPLAFLIKPFDATLLGHIIELAFQKNRNTWLEREVQLRTQEIQKQATELQKLNEMKDQIFTIIGHDLRSPINSLYSLLKMLDRQDITTEEFLAISNRLKTAVNGLHFTLNNMLKWASVQMQGRTLEKTKVDLHLLVLQTETLFKEMAENKQITLENNITTSIMVWADADQIDVILRNLVNNALKYTPKSGKITLQASLQSEFVEVVVTDTGIGMSEETQQNIFQDVPTGSQKGTQDEQGTGIRLMLCKAFAEKNGGKIAVESIIGKGSRFYFTLPLFIPIQ